MSAQLAYGIKNNWLRLLLFFLIWTLSCGIFYGVIVGSFFPIALTSSRIELEKLFSNFSFIVLTQVATFLGSVTSFYFIRTLIEKKSNPFSGFSFPLFLSGFLISASIIFLCSISMVIAKIVSFNYSMNPRVFGYIIVFFLVAISEEIVCRGYILNNLLEKMSPIFAIIISSLFFALFHVFNSSFGWVGLINIFLSGVLMAVLYLRSNNLSLPIGMHFAWNFIQGPVFGFAVSGQKEIGLFSISYQSSNDYFTGGGFGIEGSCILTPFLLLFIYLVYRTRVNNGFGLPSIS